MNELTKDQWEKSMSTGFGDGTHPINMNNPHHDKLVVKLENAEMAMSDMTKIIKYSSALQKMFKPNDELEDWVKAKLNHAADYVATIRDYLKFYHDEKSLGTSDQSINEKWSRKYKSGIDCSHPKGFSQKAHCAGRRARRAGRHTKSSSVSEVEIYNEVLKDLIEDILEEDSSMAMGAVKQINSDAQELQSMLKPNMQLPDWCKAKLNLAGEYLDDVYHHLDHFGPEGRKFDENINETDYQGMTGFHELMNFYGKASDEQRQQMDDCLANKNIECIKDLINQVTGMTMVNISESDLTPSFYRKKDRRMRMAVRPVIPELAFWVSPTGEVIKVGDHTQWVRDNRGKIFGFNAKEPYTSAFRNGYVRLVYLPQDSALRLHNSGEDDATNGFFVNGNDRTGTPPVTSQAKDAIRQFIEDKNVLVVLDDRGKLRIDEIMNESWGKTLSTAALAAAMALGTPDAQAATKVKKPATGQTVKKTSSKVFVNVDEIKTSTPSQKYTLKNEGAVRNYYLIGDKPHIGGGHHLDGSAGSRNNIRRIASMPNDNPKTNEQLMRYVEGGPATAQTFSEVLLSNDQISALFKYDYEEKVEIAKKKYKNFSNLPQLVQTMLVDSIFRGEKHPTTDKLVNSPNPDWNKVADAYLDDDEYRSSKGKGSGVFARMERNVELLKRASDTSIASLNKTKNEAI